HAIAAAMQIGFGVVEATLIDGLDRFAIVTRRTWQRCQMNNADHHLASAEDRLQCVIRHLADRFGGFCHAVSASVVSMSSFISRLSGQEPSVPARPTEMAAARTAIRAAAARSMPAARQPARQPQKTSPAPLVST